MNRICRPKKRIRAKACAAKAAVTSTPRVTLPAMNTVFRK